MFPLLRNGLDYKKKNISGKGLDFRPEIEGNLGLDFSKNEQ